MKEKFFLLRKGQVHGPYSIEQLTSAARNGKLKPDDKVRTSEQSLWGPASGFPEIKQAFSLPPEPSVSTAVPKQAPEVKKASFNRTLFGKITVSYECPRCQASLTSDEADIGKQDQCPKCQSAFLLSPELAGPINAAREAKAEEKRLADLRKQELREEQERQRAERQAEKQAAQFAKQQAQQASSQVSSVPQQNNWTNPVSYFNSSKSGACWYCGESALNGVQCSVCRMIQ